MKKNESNISSASSFFSFLSLLCFSSLSFFPSLLSPFSFFLSFSFLLSTMRHAQRKHNHDYSSSLEITFLHPTPYTLLTSHFSLPTPYSAYATFPSLYAFCSAFPLSFPFSLSSLSSSLYYFLSLVCIDLKKSNLIFKQD